ncbi:MAG: AAA family ATPase [Thiothrix litoralis]|uniref:AAA family ATPase n=1 Tax=Thiothrix litoralis TaxID=2891210 RepID=UPI003C74AF64
MIKFPYGISDFHRIRTDDYLYVDRTAFIPVLEEAGRQLIFLRPRRFGKSLLLSMLANYYDVKTTGEFDTLFGNLAIGQQPTPEHNQYLILRWDFSKVSAQGDLEHIRSSLFQHINQAIKDFVRQYQAQLTFSVDIYDDDALGSFQSVVNVAKSSGYTVYLLIDEYDNFANDVLIQDTTDAARYRELLQGEGILKTLFKIIKASASEGKIARVFITGVSPIVLSDMTSGYNVATSIYLDEDFNSLCGLTENELSTLVQQTAQSCALPPTQTATVMETLQQFYNGYRFCADMTQTTVYNPTLCFYFLRHYQKKCQAPEKMLDGNLAMDAGRIRYIAALPQGSTVIDHILDEQNPAMLQELENQFGVENLREVQQDSHYMLSLLYYFGVLTIIGRNGLGKLILGIPNLVIHSLYVERLKQHALPRTQDEQWASHLAEQFYQTADLQPLADFMEHKYFAVFSNRDYCWSNELTVKTAFLTLLFNDTWYIMDSETALQRRYSDLVMIIRPSMRHYAPLKDFIFEFNYLKLDDLKLTGEQLREKSVAELEAMPPVQKALQDALVQLRQYRPVLESKYQQPERLYCLAVVALGFERVVWRLLD